MFFILHHPKTPHENLSAHLKLLKNMSNSSIYARDPSPSMEDDSIKKIFDALKSGEVKGKDITSSDLKHAVQINTDMMGGAIKTMLWKFPEVRQKVSREPELRKAYTKPFKLR